MLSSPVLGATANADPIMLSDNAFYSLEAQLGHALAGSAVNVQSVDLSHYRYKELCISK